MKSVLFLAAAVLLSCVRSPGFQGVQVEDDKTVVFPDFFQGGVVGSGPSSQPYLLEGVTLRALLIASQDLFPDDSKNLPCWERQEGHDYRVIRQENVVFVYIYVNPKRCMRKFLAFDAGVKYAISTDGRILRRVFEGEPEGLPEPLKPDAGVQKPSREPGLSSIIKTPGDESSRYLPATWLDGGTTLDGGQ